MKHFFLLLLIASCGIYCVGRPKPASEINNLPLAESEKYSGRAKETYDRILQYYKKPTGNLFAENFPAQPSEPIYAYFWSYSTMFTAATLLQDLGYKDSSFQICYDGMEEFWDSKRLPAGYQSAPVILGDSDRFYDDNATGGLDLVELYELTKEKKYLEKAEACIDFDLDGESKDEGGGLFWCEQYRMNAINDSRAVKAVNASAFAATLAFKLYLINHKKKYLDFGKRLYHWNKTFMLDPIDGMYWNDISLLTHKINKKKWTYNAGEMLSGACLLYKITKDTVYLNDASKLAQKSYDYFTKNYQDKGRFYPNHDPWFTIILLRGFLDYFEFKNDEKYINSIRDNIDFAWTNARTEKGLFYEDWTGVTKGRDYWIINQAAMVEAYARLAIFYRK